MGNRLRPVAIVPVKVVLPRVSVFTSLPYSTCQPSDTPGQKLSLTRARQSNENPRKLKSGANSCVSPKPTDVLYATINKSRFWRGGRGAGGGGGSYAAPGG